MQPAGEKSAAFDELLCAAGNYRKTTFTVHHTPRATPSEDCKHFKPTFTTTTNGKHEQSSARPGDSPERNVSRHHRTTRHAVNHRPLPNQPSLSPALRPKRPLPTSSAQRLPHRSPEISSLARRRRIRLLLLHASSPAARLC